MHKIQVISAPLWFLLTSLRKKSADMHVMSPWEQGKTVFRKSSMNSNQTEKNSVNTWEEIRQLVGNVWFLLKEVRINGQDSCYFCLLLISYHFVKKISADMDEMSPWEQGKPVF